MSNENKNFEEQYCPFFKKMFSSTRMYCECVTIRFPDSESKKQWINSKCNSKSGCESCQLYLMLADYYERKL